MNGDLFAALFKGQYDRLLSCHFTDCSAVQCEDAVSIGAGGELLALYGYICKLRTLYQRLLLAKINRKGILAGGGIHIGHTCKLHGLAKGLIQVYINQSVGNGEAIHNRPEAVSIPRGQIVLCGNEVRAVCITAHRTGFRGGGAELTVILICAYNIEVIKFANIVGETHGIAPTVMIGQGFFVFHNDLIRCQIPFTLIEQDAGAVVPGVGIVYIGDQILDRTVHKHIFQCAAAVHCQESTLAPNGGTHKGDVSQGCGVLRRTL